MIDNKSYIHIWWWMINELELKGNDLLVYAIIYSFTNGTKDHYFNWSLNYLAEWTNSTERGIQKNLKNLIEKWYIKKEETSLYNVKIIRYRTKFQGVEQSSIIKEQSSWGVEQSSTNIQDIYTSDIQEKETYKEKVNVEEFIEKWNWVKTIQTPRWNVAWLRQCRKATDDIKEERWKVVKKYTKEQISEWVNNYIEEIRNRKKDDWYYNHRFTLYEFIKQSNWLKKFINNS